MADGVPPARREGLLLGWQISPEPGCPLGFHTPAADAGPTQGLATPELRDRLEEHVLAIARTGAGKNRSCVMPWELTYPGSMFVLDNKGENALVCGQRRAAMGQKVVVYNMFDVQRAAFHDRGMVSARYNPLDDVRLVGEDDLADASIALAELVAGPAPASLQDPFWRSSALGLLAGLIAWRVVAARFEADLPAEECSLGGVWRTLNCDDLSYHLAVILDRHGARPDFPAFVHEQFVNFLQAEAEKVRSSVRSEATSLMRVFASPRVQKTTSHSDFRLGELADPALSASIFLVMPPDRMESHAAVTRCFLGLVLMAIARRTSMPQWPTLVVVDELAQLGPLPIIKTAITLLRGYGAKLVLCVQSLAQLRGMWPLDYETILDNTALINFGNASMAGARSIAEQLGDIDERTLFNLPEDQLVIHLPGQPTQVARKLDYLRDDCFAGLYAPNPYYAQPPGTRRR